MLVLSASDVDKITNILSPDDLLTLTASVFTRLSSKKNEISAPHRTAIQSTNHTTLFMPSRIDAVGTAIKVVSVPTSSSTNVFGLPASTMILDEHTGAIKALVNARRLTALRTAAGSLLATRLVGPKVPLKLVAFGAGTLIETHVDLFLRAYPSIRTCVIVNRTANERLRALIDTLRGTQYCYRSDGKGGDNSEVGSTSRQVEFKGVDDSTLDHDSRSALLHDADVICTATSSHSPLFTSADIPSPPAQTPSSTSPKKDSPLHKRHIHINLLGSYTQNMHEVDSALIHRAGVVVVDSRSACLGAGNDVIGEAGELVKSGISGDDVIELGELLSSGNIDCKATAREWETGVDEAQRARVLSAGERAGLTVFKSVGVGVQDVAIAELVVRRAEEIGGVGVFVPGYDS